MAMMFDEDKTLIRIAEKYIMKRSTNIFRLKAGGDMRAKIIPCLAMAMVFVTSDIALARCTSPEDLLFGQANSSPLVQHPGARP
jgi:hypothetical protein